MWCPSVSLSMWANAWLAGKAAPDDVLDALSLWAPTHSVTAYDSVAAGRTGLPWPDVNDAGAVSLLQTVRTAAGRRGDPPHERRPDDKRDDQRDDVLSDPLPISRLVQLWNPNGATGRHADADGAYRVVCQRRRRAFDLSHGSNQGRHIKTMLTHLSGEVGQGAEHLGRRVTRPLQILLSL